MKRFALTAFLFLASICRAQPVASDIIRQAIEKKGANNPEASLRSFRISAYNKLLITANPDSIAGRIDSVFIGKHTPRPIFVRIDSSDFHFKNYITKYHLFESEKTSRYEFAENRLKETITGAKMGGFSQPVYEIMGVKLHSFTVYDKRYELLTTKYISPLGEDALENYSFERVAMETVDGRTTAKIAFKAKRKFRGGGLFGVLWIDLENFAVAKAEMGSLGVLSVKAIHSFIFYPQSGIWMPSETVFKIAKGRSDSNINILGTTLEFDPENERIDRKRYASDKSYVLSQTWFSNAEFNIPIEIRHIAVSSEITKAAVNRDEAFWNAHRIEPLSPRDERTYLGLDSISRSEKIESRLRLARKFLNGYIPIGSFDLGLRYLAAINNHEGFRLGLGGMTNDKFSEKYRLNGYAAYGTKDGRWKYSLGAAVRLGNYTGSWIGASFTDDLQEIASTRFETDRRPFRIYDARPINITTFYNHKTWRGYIETRIIPKTESVWQLTYSHIEPRFNYSFNYRGKSYEEFNLTLASVGIQWNPFSSYLQTPDSRIETEKRFPKFTFQFTQAMPKFTDNDFSFGKVDARIDYEKPFLDGQKFSALLQGGWAYGNVPLTHLYSMTPNNPVKDHIQQRITFSGKNSFETMFYNEFFTSRYAMLQLKHSSPRVTIVKKVRPFFTVVTRGAFGSMENREQHSGFDYKTLDKGFFESGLEVNQIYSGLGISGFYRYGTYSMPDLEDNIAIKLTFTLNLGI
ncbi:DUF5686 family protein [Flavobacterium selenitireducens]|uniref:DUF5686 family protein n=1 Tax=Flavobacterium selenitireducens TaxID=2722704 RepID=UPI00168BD0A7|nr:DUF5686 family protein [Flavobacterium selenitireducens]MBD3581939.1 carboxypeptidase-like regulatory domain-containing protein [Flavobacterium selenitireducens]